jgi:hypothetical protein
MKGDFTRETFKREKHYNSVRMQQGRVLLDADWNEQADIQTYLRETEAKDVIGQCGVPIHSGGFKISPTGDNRDLVISPGRIYVDGILCENEPSYLQAIIKNKNTTSKTTEVLLPALIADGRKFEIGQWVELSSRTNGSSKNQPMKILTEPSLDIAGSQSKNGIMKLEGLVDSSIQNAADLRLRRITTIFTQPDCSVKMDNLDSSAKYVAYLDVWKRHITALEDEDIRESALGGPDTTTRTRTVWQVKLQKIDPEKGCDDFPDDWHPMMTESSGQMAARVKPNEGNIKPCELPAAAGYSRLQNYLYRIEIHEPSPSESVTFKWSRDNGSVAASWDGQRGSDVLIISRPGRDRDEFAPGKWVELIDDNRELLGKPGIMLKLLDVQGMELKVDPTKSENVQYPSDIAQDISRIQRSLFAKPRIRLWDTEAKPIKTTANDGWIELKNEGIEVQFDSRGFYQSGDFWQIPARTAGKKILWPYDDDLAKPLFEFKQGIEHHYCPLAICTFDRNSWSSTVSNCPAVFPPLTELPNQPVSGSEKGCCTFIVGTDTRLSLESAIQEILKGDLKDVCICLLPGEHILLNDLEIKKESVSNFKLKGCGRGATVKLEESKKMHFDGLRSVFLEDIDVKGSIDQGLLINFTNCQDVLIYSCDLRQWGRGSLLQIDGSDRVQIEKSLLDSSESRSRNALEFVLGNMKRDYAILSDQIEALATEIGIQGGKRMVKKANFTDKSMPFATILANSEERVLIAESVKAYADEAVRLFGLENETKESYYRVADAIGSAKDAVSVAKPIGKITKEAAESVSGFSLFLKNIINEAIISDNDIIGEMIMNEGNPYDVDFSEMKERMVKDNLFKEKLDFAGTEGIMKIRGNKIDSILSGSSNINRIMDSRETISIKSFEEIFMSENIVHNRIQLLAKRISLISNSFNRYYTTVPTNMNPVFLNFGWIISESAIFMGNSGTTFSKIRLNRELIEYKIIPVLDSCSRINNPAATLANSIKIAEV